MGACGCVEIQYAYRLDIPDGVLMIGVYPSCRYCSSPCGVQFYALSKRDADDWFPNVKALDITGNGLAFLPVIDPSVLQEIMKKSILETNWEEDTVDETLAEVVAEETFPDCRDAVAATQKLVKEWDERAES